MESPLAEAPLFPLPEGALLPGELLPLHVFEPRYRVMMEHLRRGDRLLGIATLLPGWESDPLGRPPVADVVGLGRIVRDRLNDNGTSDIIVHGLLRGEIVEELPSEPFRRARLRLLETGDRHPAESWRQRRELLTALSERLRQRAFRFDLTASFDAGALIDRMACALDLAPEERVQLLQAVGVERRAELLLELLRSRRHRQRLIEIIPSLNGFSLGLDGPGAPPA